MGPLELIDMIGLDVNLAATRRIYEATGRNPRYKPSPLQERMVSAGLLGRKSGEGFHRYGGSPSERMEAHADTEVPNTITVQGDLGPAQPLVGLWNERGLEVKQESGPGQVLAGQAVLRLTRGRRVSERNMVLLDLSLDYAQAETVALAAADEGLDDAVGLFQAIGKKVCVVKDLPGMLVARTVCMLINEAMDSLHRGIATREDIEMAMKLGLNFPGGPFEWLERLGAPYVLSVLQGVRDATGDPRYEPSPLLRSRAEAAHA
jgi:3-hydroxybutyryl-CoA dehydrogenase